MRIAVNTRLLLKNKLEGIGRFSLEMLSRIAIAHPEHEFIFIFDRAYDEKFIFSKNIIPVVIGPQARHPFLFLIWFELSIPRVLKKYNVDLFLSPDGFLSLRSNRPSIVVIHDLNFEHYPKDLPKLVLKYYKYFVPKFIKKASHIATVSEYSKRDIINLYSTDENKITVVHNGVNEVYGPIEASDIPKIKGKYTKGENYFLYVGALHQRKNLVNLFKAFDSYKKTHQTPTKLLIVGNKMWWTKSIEGTYNAMQFKDDVVFHSHMSTIELKEVYGAALALVYVSYFEGFGIPIIESFACGTPVITSNVTSMPEVAGDAALIINPFDVDEIARALFTIETDISLRKKLIAAGMKRYKDFSWDKSAEKLWEIIDNVQKT